MSLSNRTQIYRSGNKLGLSPSDIDVFLNCKISEINTGIYSGNIEKHLFEGYFSLNIQIKEEK